MFRVPDAVQRERHSEAVRRCPGPFELGVRKDPGCSWHLFVRRQRRRTSRSRKVSTTVQIWRPPACLWSGTRTVGVDAVYNGVLGPDLTRLEEVGMDGERVIGVDIGNQWLDVARETAAEVNSMPTRPPPLQPSWKSGSGARHRGVRALRRLRARAGNSAGGGTHALGGGASARVQAVRRFRASRPRPIRSMHGCCRVGRDRVDAGKCGWAALRTSCSMR